ncbi:hypothetical protein CEXT_733191 [Caerostris extrusa]|uniref:Secreted protein n=1 Tax=Caerostris extrusa TaxID=172846 RepID=A0AAV4R2E5_CAEEX|nr:hypothetical protein CEXT_733191 [Caerostris extrusa]
MMNVYSNRLVNISLFASVCCLMSSFFDFGHNRFSTQERGKRFLEVLLNFLFGVRKMGAQLRWLSIMVPSHPPRFSRHVIVEQFLGEINGFRFRFL